MACPTAANIAVVVEFISGDFQRTVNTEFGSSWAEDFVHFEVFFFEKSTAELAVDFLVAFFQVLIHFVFVDHFPTQLAPDVVSAAIRLMDVQFGLRKRDFAAL